MLSTIRLHVSALLTLKNTSGEEGCPSSLSLRERGEDWDVLGEEPLVMSIGTGWPKTLNFVIQHTYIIHVYYSNVHCGLPRLFSKLLS